MSRPVSWLPYAVFLAILLCQADFVPLWDAWIYAECAADAARAPEQLRAYSCAGHLSHVYIALIALPSLLSGKQQMWHLLLVNAVLGCVGIRATMSIARSMYPAREHDWEVLLTGLMIAVHPQLLASAVFVNVDFAVYVFGMSTVATLLRRRYEWAAFAGCCLVLSKETGLGVYLIAVGCHAVLRLGLPKHSGSRANRVRATNWLLLGAPVAALCLILYAFPNEHPRFVDQSTPREWLGQFLTIQFSSPHEHAAWAALGVLQFQWLLLGSLLAVTLHHVANWSLGRRIAIPIGMAPRAIATVAGIGLLSALALTRPQAYVNTRYFTIVYALIALLFVVAVVFVQSVLLRRSILLGVTGLLALSAFRTIDPVSKALYGTFEFGDHPMLRMTSISKECCGAGIDQLAYNLEFVQYHRVLDAATRRLRPDRERLLVVETGMNAALAMELDPVTRQRTMPSPSSLRRSSADLFGLLRVVWPKPRELIFLALPNAGEAKIPKALRQWYDPVDVEFFEHDGYGMFGFLLKRRGQ